jgi:hypothetical protein
VQLLATGGGTGAGIGAGDGPLMIGLSTSPPPPQPTNVIANKSPSDLFFIFRASRRNWPLVNWVCSILKPVCCVEYGFPQSTPPLVGSRTAKL